MVQLDGRSQSGARGHTGSVRDIDIAFTLETFTPSSIPGWMLNDHYQEIASHKKVFKRPEPDVDYYMAAQQRGELVFVTARNGSRDLVGYAALLLRPHPHYRSVIAAVGDLHYLIPALRGVGIGSAMLEFAEKAAKERGAQVFSMRDKAEHAHRAMWESMGYKLTDFVYVKDIRDAPA